VVGAAAHVFFFMMHIFTSELDVGFAILDNRYVLIRVSVNR